MLRIPASEGGRAWRYGEFVDLFQAGRSQTAGQDA